MSVTNGSDMSREELFNAMIEEGQAKILSNSAAVVTPGLTISSDVPSVLLNKYSHPEYTWPDGELYDKTARHLMKM